MLTQKGLPWFAVGLLAITCSVVGCGGSSSSGTKATGTTDLSTAALRTSEVPAGYSDNKTRVFEKYTKLSIAFKGCDTPSAITPKTWKQGFIQVLLSKSHTGFVGECAYLLRNASAAHGAYAGFKADLARTSPTLKPTTGARIGDESTLFSDTASGGRAYLFRRISALEWLVFSPGPSSPAVSASQFTHLANTVNSRLK